MKTISAKTNIAKIHQVLDIIFETSFNMSYDMTREMKEYYLKSRYKIPQKKIDKMLDIELTRLVAVYNSMNTWYCDFQDGEYEELEDEIGRLMEDYVFDYFYNYQH